MFGWLARLFPIQALRTENEMLSAQLNAAQADLMSAREEMDELRAECNARAEHFEALVKDKDRIWALAEKAIEGERFANHTAYNHEVQRHGGGIPYPEAHSLPVNIVPPVQKSGPIGRGGRMLASQEAYVRSRQAIREYFTHAAADNEAPRL